jgi:hypothetical protein
MKTKIILFFAISTLITLSFSFISVPSRQKIEETRPVIENASNEPAGGFASEDKL